MPVERTSGESSHIDMLDRVLDKGIVIDAWLRAAAPGIDLTRGDRRVVVVSVELHLDHRAPPCGAMGCGRGAPERTKRPKETSRSSSATLTTLTPRPARQRRSSGAE